MTRSATRPDVELLGFQVGLRVVVVGPRMPLADELGDADTRNSDQEPERSGNYPGSHELGVLPELVDRFFSGMASARDAACRWWRMSSPAVLVRRLDRDAAAGGGSAFALLLTVAAEAVWAAPVGLAGGLTASGRLGGGVPV
jgi:hypothetical protein